MSPNKTLPTTSKQANSLFSSWLVLRNMRKILSVTAWTMGASFLRAFFLDDDTIDVVLSMRARLDVDVPFDEIFPPPGVDGIVCGIRRFIEFITNIADTLEFVLEERPDH